MTLCVCDGPPHPYDRDWCRAGRSAGYPHGAIDPGLELLDMLRLQAAVANDPWRTGNGRC